MSDNVTSLDGRHPSIQQAVPSAASASLAALRMLLNAVTAWIAEVERHSSEQNHPMAIAALMEVEHAFGMSEVVLKALIERHRDGSI